MFWDIDQINFSSCPFFLSDPSPIIGNACHSLTDSLPNWLTDSLLFSKLDWCGPGMWRWQLKNCWDCYCCSCWQSETCWQHFGADLEGDLVIRLSFCSYFEHKVFKVWSIFAVDASCDYEVQDRFGQELVIWPKEVTLISRTQPSGPLCLWQCFENETSRAI